MSSSSNSSFIYVDNKVPINTVITIDINNSHFENCSALYGGVIFSNANITLKINNSNFVNNFAIDSGVMRIIS